jgi:two-component system, OmpR family, response regulator QseB
MRILIVEDDAMIGRALAAGLARMGHRAELVCDAAEAERAMACGGYHIALLDLGLPDKGGTELLKEWRERGHQLPVLIITARDTVAERVAGLDCGADDYLPKPFHLEELLARIRAVCRRRAGPVSKEVRYGALSLDAAHRIVRFRGAEAALSPREFALLEVLMRHPGAIVAREELAVSVYGTSAQVRSNALEVHLHKLRRKLHPHLIMTVRGAGYRLAPVD